MFKTYTIAADGYDFAVTLQIDTTVLTKDIATKINDLYDNGELVLKVSNGDVYKAVARQVAFEMFHSLVEGYNSEQAIQLFSQQMQEYARLSSENLGIEVVSCGIRKLDAALFECSEHKRG
jgi:hypothetical protein